VSSCPVYGEMYSIRHYVIKFVSDLRQVSGFPRVPPVSSTNKTDRHDIAKILLKVALNTINQTKPYIFAFIKMVEKREGQPIMYNPERYGQHLAQDTKRRQIYKKLSFGVKLNVEVYNLYYSRFVAYTCHLCCFV